MSTTLPPPPDDAPARIHAALRSVHRFDEIEVRPIMQTLVTLDERATCFRLLYYRTVNNVASLISLNNQKHFQAHTILSRALFELNVDLKLMGMLR